MSLKLIFLFLNQNICCGYSKEPSQCDSSFESPVLMFKFIDRKKSQFYVKKSLCFSGPMIHT